MAPSWERSPWPLHTHSQVLFPAQEAHIAQLVSQMEVLLSVQPISTADIVGLQGEASQLPGWAAHRAHMELGMRLNQKQR